VAAKRPNILLITTDQQRGDALGVDGNPVLRTPVLDDLARTGVWFSNAYSEAPVCVPMRSCWMTGRHPLNLGQNRWRGDPLTRGEILPDALSDAGYRTGVFGKRHFSPVREPYGFHEMRIHESGRMGVDREMDDDYLAYLRRETEWGGYSRGHGVGNNDVYAAASLIPESDHISSWTARESVGFIERHARERPDAPFFCWCSFNKPHSPHDPPRPYDALYRPQDVPAPSVMPNGVDDELPVNQRRVAHYMWQTVGDGQMRASLAYYYGLITHIDVCVGRLMQALGRMGLRDDTIIAFTSDHGDMMGDHNQYFKTTFYEGSARVPHLFYLPQRVRDGRGATAVGRLSAPVGVSSLMPTLLDLADVPKPASADGDTLLDAMRGGEAPNGGEVAAAYGLLPERLGPGHSAMLRWDRYKYIYWQPGAVGQLFDVEADPGELRDLADVDGYQDVLAEAHARLERRLGEYEYGRSEVLRDGKLIGAPFDPTQDWSPPASGPWGRRPL
jgi:arylsulfatase